MTSAYFLARSTLQPNGCRLWSGVRYSTGYGRIGHLRFGTQLAHRAVWIEAHGAIPKGRHVCHACDTPACINLDHLWLGTAADNAADRQAKRRGAPQGGENNPHAKLTPELVVAIRSAAGSQREIAKRFGICQPHVSDIKRGIGWANVKIDQP